MDDQHYLEVTRKKKVKVVGMCSVIEWRPNSVRVVQWFSATIDKNKKATFVHIWPFLLQGLDS
jgi:hypothetical protein